VSAKRLIRANVNMLAAVPVTLLLGGAALAPWTVPSLARLATPRSLTLVAWLGPVTVALAYWLYVAGLRRLTAATAATLSLAEPLVATALGIGILRERLSLPIAAGTLLLLGGLVLVSVPRPRAGPRPQPPAGSRPAGLEPAEPGERPVTADSSPRRTRERLHIPG
jgi:drug/metabolite transporter, DME family